MALAPDILDRTLFLFVLSSPVGSRLVAHTLLFELLVLLLLTGACRKWWMYGAASAFHLLLDSVNFSWAWAQLALWPFLGGGWQALGLAHGVAPSLEQVPARLETLTRAYAEAPGWLWLLECGGGLVLAWFAYRKRLFQRARLRRLVTHGSI